MSGKMQTQKKVSFLITKNRFLSTLGQELFVIIWPVMLPLHLNTAQYVHILRYALPALLQDVPLDIQRRMWYQHEDATPHFSLQIREHLRGTFG